LKLYPVTSIHKDNYTIIFLSDNPIQGGEEEESTINEFRVQKRLLHPKKFVIEVITNNDRKKVVYCDKKSMRNRSGAYGF
jgi:hypothetical protein